MSKNQVTYFSNRTYSKCYKLTKEPYLFYIGCICCRNFNMTGYEFCKSGQRLLGSAQLSSDSHTHPILHKVSRFTVANLLAKYNWRSCRNCEHAPCSLNMFKHSNVYPIWLNARIQRMAEVKIIDVCKTRIQMIFVGYISWVFFCVACIHSSWF